MNSLAPKSRRQLTPRHRTLVDAFCMHLQSLGKSCHTIQGRRASLNRWFEWLEKSKIAQPTEQDVRRFINPINSSYNIFSSIRTFYSWAESQKICKAPVATLWGKELIGKRFWPTTEQHEMLSLLSQRTNISIGEYVRRGIDLVLDVQNLRR